MKKTSFALLAAMAVASQALAYDASCYVQDGLLACWDGIDNAGYGVHNSSATVWLDQSGRYGFTLTGVSVYNDRMYFSGTATALLGSAGTAATFTAARNGTLEIVYKSSNTSGTRFLFESSTGNSSTSTLTFLTEGGTKVHGCTAASGNKATYYSFTSGAATNRVAIRYSNGRTASAIGNGATLSSGGTDYWGTDNSGTTILGARLSKNSSQYFNGSIYCIRLYGRQLTDAEIAANQAIDVARFREGRTEPAMKISGIPGEIGTPSPAYGALALESGENCTLTFPAGVSTNNGSIMESRGWRLDLADGTSFSGDTFSTNIVYSSALWRSTFYWVFAAEHLVECAAANGGAVSSTGGYYPDGTVLSFTATPDATNIFYKWAGDVPDGVDPKNPTISFPADRPRSMTALFAPLIHLSTTGSDANDGASWATAIATVTNAVAKGCAAGSVVVISNGTYSLPNAITLTNAITLRGVTGNPADVIIRRPSSATAEYRLFNMKHRESVLSGLTLTGGRAHDTYISGGAVYIYSGGTITNCVLRSNHTQGHHAVNGGNGTGSAVYCDSSYGIVTHCVISNNTTTIYDNNFGGPICMNYGRIDNCLVTKHNETTSNYGGMIVLNNSAVAENCTVVANHAAKNAGIYTRSASARVRNCVIAANTSTSSTASDTVWGGTSSCFTNCVSDAYAPNAQCHAGADLVFVDAGAGDWHPTLASSAVDVGGTVVNGSTVDLDGNPRVVDAIDAGCYELQKDGLIIGFTPNVSAAFLPASVTFSAIVAGVAPGDELEYRWDFDNDGTVDEATTEPSITHVYTAGGVYSVTLTVADITSGNSTSITMPNVFKANPPVLYVVNGNPDAAEPYDTWAIAASTIQKAINYSADGAEVVVSNGTYKIPSSIYVDKVITVRGLTGRPEDVIVDAQASTRCLEMNAGKKALVHSLTLRNGKLSHNYDYGAGAYVYTSGGTVSNCIVRGCQTSGKWAACGGVYGSCANALFTHCVVTNNTASTGQSDGGYLSGIAVQLSNSARIEHSLIANNRYTGGYCESTVHVGNGTVRFCTIVGNKARAIGGVNLAGSSSKVEHCIIEGNTSSFSDPNTYTDSLRYKVWGAGATYNKSGIASDDATRATLTISRQITNCVADAVLVNDWCHQEAISTTLPKYVAKGDPTPGPSSIARNAVGTTGTYVMPETDVLRRPRLFGSRYDLGAVESQRNASLVLMLQ